MRSKLEFVKWELLHKKIASTLDLTKDRDNFYLQSVRYQLLIVDYFLFFSNSIKATLVSNGV